MEFHKVAPHTEALIKRIIGFQNVFLRIFCGHLCSLTERGGAGALQLRLHVACDSGLHDCSVCAVHNDPVSLPVHECVRVVCVCVCVPKALLPEGNGHDVVPKGKGRWVGPEPDAKLGLKPCGGAVCVCACYFGL